MGGENCEPNRLELAEIEEKGGENREPNGTELAEDEQRRICEECHQESCKGKLGDWGDFEGKWYCATCWVAWGQWMDDAWKYRKGGQQTDNAMRPLEQEVIKRREQSRLKLRDEIADRARRRAEAEASDAQQRDKDAKVGVSREVFDEEVAAFRIAQRRRQLCKSPGCNFCVHSDPRVGDFCCFNCNKTEGKRHGERCQQREMRTKVWPHERGAPCVYVAEEDSLEETERADPLEAARAEAEEVAAKGSEAEKMTGPPLIQAVAKGDLRKVMKPVRDGADSNVRGPSGDSVLTQASKRGKTDLVAVLLLRKANPFLLNSTGQTADDVAGNVAVKALLRLFRYERRDDATEQTALGGLSVSLRKEVAEHFQIEHVSEDAPAPDPVAISIKLGEAPLIKAVRDGDLQVVWDMLSKGADPNVRDILGETPLFEAVASGRVDMVACLLLLGASPLVAAPNGHTAYSMANDSVLRALLRVFGERQQITGPAVHMALHGIPASSSLQLKISQEIAQRFATGDHTPEVQRVAKSFTGSKAEQTNALLEAVRAGDLERMLGLLSGGVDPNVKDYVGETPLFEASAGTSSGSSDLVAALLLRRADPSARRQDGKTCIQIAATDSARALLQLFSMSFAMNDAKNVLGSALEGLLLYKNEVVDWYRSIDLNSDKVLEELSGEPSLIVAVREGKVKEVANLLQAGEDPNMLDVVGEPPLFEAAASGNSDIVAALLLARANLQMVASDGRQAASMAGSPAVEALLQLFQPGGHLHADLKRAALSDLVVYRERVIRHLEKHKEVAKKSSAGKQGEARLAQAVRSGNLQNVLSLLKAGDDPNVWDIVGETPLFEAAASDDLDVVAALLVARADANLQSPTGQTAQEINEKEGMANLFRLFEGRCPHYMQQSVLSSLGDAMRVSVAQHLRLGQSLPRAATTAEGPIAKVNEKLTNAVCCDDLESVRAALQEGADPDTLNFAGETQLFEAVTSCSLDMVALLLINGADSQKPSASGLAEDNACDVNFFTLLKLFQEGDVEPADIANMLRGIRDTAIYEQLRSDLATIGFEHIAG